MSLTSRLLGVRSAAPAAPAQTRPPQAATQPVGYSAPNSPMTPRWNAESAVAQGYYGYLYAYRCARTIATTIAGLPFRAGLNPSSPGAYDLRAPLAAMLGPAPGGPAPNISPRQLWTWSLIGYLITGRFAWETVAPPGSAAPAALWPLVAANLKPIPTDGGAAFFSGYEYQANARIRPLTPAQVFYCWRASQDDWREPESVLQAAALPLSLGVALDRYMAAFMRNNMTGAKMVVTPGFEDSSMRRAFQDQFLSEMTGVDNAGNTAFAEWEDDAGTGKTPSIQVVDLGTRPVDAQVTDLQKWVRDTVCDAFGVPISIVGQASERTYANADQEHRNYWTGTILPFIEEILDHVNIGLAPRVGDEVGWFDLSSVEALKPASRFQQADPVSLVNGGIVQASEIREDLGLAPQIPAAGETDPPEPLPAVDDTPGVSKGGTGAGGGSRDATSVEPREVLAYLSDNYPPRVLGWVNDATWTRQSAVPLTKIKMSRRPGGRDFEKVDAIAAAIKSGKRMDPVVLVDTGEDQYEIADGYHRLLAFERAGVKTVDVYVGSGAGMHGPWEREMHDAKLNTSPAEKTTAGARDGTCPAHGERAGTCTGPGPCVTTPFGAGKNWVTKVGGLPDYVRAVAHAFQRKGMPESESIERALGVIQNWASGQGNVTAATRARAAAAWAEWQAKKAAAHASRDGALVTETGSSAALLPKVAPKLARHLPTRGPAQGICGRCGQKATAKIHEVGRRRKPRTRHAGVAGHAHVSTGHHSAARRVVARQVSSHADAMEPAIDSAMRSLFTAQRKATIDRLHGNRGKTMLRAVQPPEGEKPVQPAPIVDGSQVFDYTHWVDRTQAALEPFYAAVAALPQPRLAKFPATASSRLAIASAVKARSMNLAQSVSRTTLDQIQAALTEGIASGASIDQLTQAVSAVFDHADETRARTIARTESMGAINSAADAHAASLGSTVVAGKEWAAAHDERVRPAHREADGQVRAMGAPFLVGGFPMTGPGDPAAPPDETVNCRCTSLYLTPSEYAKRVEAQAPIDAPIAA